MWANLGIGRKLAVAFGAVVLAAIALGVIAWGKVDAIGAGWNGFETVTLKKRDATADGLSGLMNGIHHFKNYVLRGGDYDKKFRDDMAAILKAAQGYRQVGQLNVDEEKALGQIEQGVQTYLVAIDAAVKSRGDGMIAT